MKYRVRSVGKDLEGKEVGEILCGENTSLEYVGRVSKDRKGPTLTMTGKGIETPEQEI